MASLARELLQSRDLAQGSYHYLYSLDVCEMTSLIEWP